MTHAGQPPPAPDDPARERDDGVAGARKLLSLRVNDDPVGVNGFMTTTAGLPEHREFTGILSILERRWWVVAVTAIVAVTVALVGSSLLPARYSATMTLQLPTPAALGADVRPDDLSFTDRLMNTYKQIAESSALHDDVIRKARVPDPLDVSVEIEPNTELMRLTVTSERASDVRHAAYVAAAELKRRVIRLASDASKAGERNIAAQLEVLAREITSLRRREAAAQGVAGPAAVAERAAAHEQVRVKRLSYAALVQQQAALQLSGAQRAVGLSIAEPPSRPESAAALSTPLLVALALIIGALGGAALTLALERRRPRLHTLRQIERASGAPVLGTIPLSRPAPMKALFEAGSYQEEAFGKLRARLLPRDGGEAPSTVLVTSAYENEGKSTVAANLAAALAQSGRRVLLVDADMRFPSVHGIFEVANGSGLSELLQRQVALTAEVQMAIRQTDIPNLSVLPGGPEPESPAQLLASPQLMAIVSSLRRSFEYVVIDSPPLLPVSDAVSLARVVDCTLIVIGSSPVTHQQLQSVRRQLGGVGARSVGVVVNRWVETGEDRKGRYYR